MAKLIHPLQARPVFGYFCRIVNQQTFIVAAQRSAIGRFGGALGQQPLAEWGTTVLRATVKAAGLAPEVIEEVILGQTLGAGHGITVARRIALQAGLADGSRAWTLNQACASGMVAVQHADRMIRCGDAAIIVAGGVEHMSAAPFISRSLRWGARFGAAKMEDEVENGLTCPVTALVMGCTAENIRRQYNISRQEQDEFAHRSQELAHAAIQSKRFADEIVPIEIAAKQAKIIFDIDEHPRLSSVAVLGKLKPAFDAAGTVTAGNASGINDGAAMLVVASAAAVNKHGLQPVARIVASATSGVDPKVMGLGPILAIQRVLAKAGLTLADMELFEINEAFAVQVLGVLREVPVPLAKLNVNGGGIALGHPTGCSGARILVTLIHEMKKRGLRFGLASLCVGGGMGAATIVEVL